MNKFQLAKFIEGLLNCLEFFNKSVKRKNAFTRKGKMSFKQSLMFMLDMNKTSLQARLNIFFDKTQGGEPMSQQAFSKLRNNFDHTPLELMARGLVKKEYSGEYELPLWKGYHLISVDGTTIQLPREEVLRSEFGVLGGGTCPGAGVSMVYDVLNGWVLDATITHSKMNERKELLKHLEFLTQEMPHITENSLFLHDRGYASLAIFAKMHEIGIKYVMRCKKSDLKEINKAPLGDSLVKLRNGITIRVIKFKLENSDDIKILATNEFDLPADDFPDLYTKRWGIETLYNELKNIISIEKFSGRTVNSILQDFWASIVLINSVAVFMKDANEEATKLRAGKQNKHVYKSQVSMTVVTLRDQFVFYTLMSDQNDRAEKLNKIIKMIARKVSCIRKNRSYKRSFKNIYNANQNLKSRL